MSDEVERIIRSTGFYKVKARNITGAAEKLVLDYNSEVPLLMDELPGNQYSWSKVLYSQESTMLRMCVKQHLQVFY